MPQHSSQFIQEMKAKLLAEKKQLEQELGALAHKEGPTFEASFPDYGRSDEDNAAEIADFTALSATTEAGEKRLESIKAALLRIEQGTYGLTDEGRLIPEDRLRANPAATTLVEGGGRGNGQN